MFTEGRLSLVEVPDIVLSRILRAPGVKQLHHGCFQEIQVRTLPYDVVLVEDMAEKVAVVTL
jgi:hypothetical protein